LFGCGFRRPWRSQSGQRPHLGEVALPVAELAAGRFAIELPVDLDAISIHSRIPGSRFPAQGPEIGDPPVAETLPSEQADFDFRLVEPTAVLRRVMDGETISDFAGHFRPIEIG
jgi:hypothetical protein